MSFHDRALQLLDQMVLNRLGERPLFFICHSLGGLVTKEILRASYDDTTGSLNRVFHNTRAVMFLATPHTGADLASRVDDFKKLFGATVTIRELRLHDAELRNLYDWYRNHSAKAGIETFVYFEQRSLMGLMIVDPNSAHPGIGANPVALDENHLSIAKPRDRKSQVYVKANDILRKFVLASKPTLTARIASSSEIDGLDEGFRIAVLPFKSVGKSAALAELAEGLTDDIVDGMSRFSYLCIIAPDSLLPHDKEHGARFVVKGTLRQENSEVRITVNLVDTVTGKNLCVDRYTCAFSPKARFKLQDKLVPRIVSTVADARGVLAQVIGESLRERSVEELSPYEAVLRSFAYFNRLSEEEHKLARSALELAVAKAPGHSAARAWLAITYRDEYVHGFTGLPDPLGRAFKTAHKAIELGPANHWAHLALASVLYYQRDIPAFQSKAEEAIKSNPMDGSSMAYLASLLAVSGEWERGCTLMKKAQGLNPKFPGWYWIPAIGKAYREGHYRKALELALKINMPHFWIGQFLLAAIYGQLGELKKAEEAVHNLRALRPEFNAREEFAKRYYEQEFLEHLIEGLRKAGMKIADGA